MAQQGKDLILEAARQQILDDGVDSLSVRSVAKRAHYSPAGLYRHFESIEHLRHSLIHQIAEEFRLMLVGRFTEAEYPAAKNIIRYTVEWAGEQGPLAELLLREPAQNFWPEDFQLAWMDLYPRMNGISIERRRVIIVVAWDALRSIVLAHTISEELDYERLFENYADFIAIQIAEGVL